MRIDSILILAAGKGTRLKPFTDHLPKSLLPLGNTNILRNLIEQSEEYFTGVKIYVNASYLAEKIIEEINNFSITIRPYIIWEQYPLGPAFTVTNHCNETNGNVLVIHGDNSLRIRSCRADTRLRLSLGDQTWQRTIEGSFHIT